MLKANALSFEREDRVLFSGITLEVEPGSMLFVSGTNGSGKSSLLKILAGIWRPSTGSVSWKDKDIEARDPYYLADLLYIGHKIGIEPALTPLQNLTWLLGIRNVNPIDQADLLKVLQIVGLGEFFDVPCEHLSQGQCQRVALASLWLKPGSCWILDEPLTALDDKGVELFYERCLTHLSKKGIIVIASHRSLEISPYKKFELRLGNKT